MATAPYFHWPQHTSSDAVAGSSSGAPELISLPATTAVDTGVPVVSPERAVPARTRVRRNSSGSGKHQAGGGAKKPPQRGLGVAELERLRCGGDPLRELAGVEGDVSAQVHPLMHCNHNLPLLAPPAAPPQPARPGCYVHHPAPEQRYFVDRWGRVGPGFSPTGNAGGGEHHQAQQLLPPEHPSSQNSIWRPAASSSSSCIQSGHRCDLCARRMTRAYAERGAPPPAVPDYSIYDLAAAMATAHQGETAAFLVRDRKRGALPGEEPAKKEVREIEFFPAASTHNAGDGIGTGPDESELVAPAVSSYGAGSFAAPPPLDLSLRL